MTEHDIKTFLTIGENIVIEFKRAGDGPKADTYESICAFLNRNGGDIFLGVADDGKVIGLPPKAAPMMVRQIVNVMNDPNLWEPRIDKFFHEIGRADELGSGVRNLYHYVKLYSGADPILDEKDIFRLTVPLDADYSPEKGNMRSANGTTEKTTEKTTRKTTEKKEVRECSSAESRLRAIITRNPTATMSEMAREMNMSEDGIYYHIKALKEAGKLQRIGGRRAGHWEFVDRGKN